MAIDMRKNRPECKSLTVSADGSGDFASIGEALNCLDHFPEGPARIYIKTGVYRERLHVRRPYLTMEGEDPFSTVVTWDYGADMLMEDKTRRGTFRSYTALIDTHDFTADNICFENSAGPGEKAGQALALYVDGDHILFRECRILGHQDTLFTGPLPPKEIEKNGFAGPKQNAPRINGRQYYKDCFIRGDIDFIFGSATAYFENCELFSLDINKEVNGYVTAASTPRGQDFGYVFESCRFTGNCPDESVYLGRPWRNFARTILLNCWLGPHISRQGWHDWGKEEAHDTALYAEYNSRGPGSVQTCRPAWTILLNREQAGKYTKDNVLGPGENWHMI